MASMMRPLPICVILASLSACSIHFHHRPQLTAGIAPTREQVTKLLIHQGYRDITDLHKNGEDWFGKATKHGVSLNFDVDKNGTVSLISPQREQGSVAR